MFRSTAKNNLSRFDPRNCGRTDPIDLHVSRNLHGVMFHKIFKSKDHSINLAT